VMDDYLGQLFGDQETAEEAKQIVEDGNEPPLLHPEGMTETHEEHPTLERHWDVL